MTTVATIVTAIVAATVAATVIAAAAIIAATTAAATIAGTRRVDVRDVRTASAFRVAIAARRTHRRRLRCVRIIRIRTRGRRRRRLRRRVAVANVPFGRTALARIIGIRTLLHTIDRATMPRRIRLNVRAQLMAVYILAIRRITRRLNNWIMRRITIVTSWKPRPRSTHCLKLPRMPSVFNRHAHTRRRRKFTAIRTRLAISARSMCTGR
jgi:hypothetical protein